MKRGRVVVTGAGGQLGRQLVTAFAAAGWQATGLSHGQLDISDRATLSEEMDGLRPDVVINAAAWTDVDGCARDPERALAVNGSAAGLVAEAAAEVDAVIVQISTNEVFDGQHLARYAEDDEPRPINPYGASKLAGERLVSAANARHLIVRTAWIFGPGGRNFPSKILEAARRKA